ncbi:MAG: AIDA repeat-containing protein [Lentisphaeria bacterium]|nr:AIDA repeat-containing protein [Lentisphaeria bacterium]
MASYEVTSGVTSAGLILNKDTMYVSEGGVADGITINSGGSLIVFSGGTATNTAVNSGGYVKITSGGTATGIIWTPCEGKVDIGNGAVVTFVEQISGVYYGSNDQLLSHADTMNGKTFDRRSMEMHVMRDGTVYDTTINSGGSLAIYSGGKAVGTTFRSYGFISVYGGGTADSSTLESNGHLFVHSGGAADNTTLGSDGFLFVSAGGAADNSEIKSGGKITVSAGGKADNTAVNGGDLIVSSGGTADNTSVNGGNLIVSSGGTATNIDWTPCAGIVSVENGGTATFVSEYSGTYYGSNGQLLSHDDMMDGMELGNGGEMYAMSGGTAVNTMIEWQGILTIASGGKAGDTSVNGGSLIISNGGTADNTSVNWGTLTISSGGTAGNTTVEGDGNLTVSSGGTASDIAVRGGGKLTVLAGGLLNGQMTFDEGATVNMDSGSILLFDLASIAPGNNAPVNDISLINGNPNFTVMVSESQESGAYRLAGNAKDFTGVITVQDTDGRIIGSLSPFEIFRDGETCYTLGISDRDLVLTIGGPDTTAPAFSGVTADIVSSDSAFQGVALTPAFRDDVALKDVFYRIGEDAEWSVLGDEGVTVTEDTTVYFKAVDIAGNESEVVGHTVENIPKAEQKPVYVYLDFDGQRTTYDNRALKLSFAVTVRNSGFSDEQQQAILTGLAEKYEADGVVFMLERPADESIEYSTLYFGKTSAFDAYGEFFGVAETHDGNNMSATDEAFILLDRTYSTDQAISVAAQNLDHLLGNSCLSSTANALADYAVKTVMLSTEWNQHSPYNNFCPIDPSTKDRCVTGCTNTAAAQLIYYWLEKGMLDFSLNLDLSDSYTKNNITINAMGRNASQYGYKAYSQVNMILSECNLNDSAFLSALCFAAGVVQKAEYGSDGTATSWGTRLFTRSGFNLRRIMNLYYPHVKDRIDLFSEDDQCLTDEGFAVLINELINGRPVGASIQYPYGKGKERDDHAVVIDGYNSATNEIHVNFGWGGYGEYSNSTRWYRLDEFNKEYGISQLIIGIIPNVSPSLTVSGLSSEADCFNSGDVITLDCTISNQGTEKSSETVAYVYCDDTMLGSAVLDSISAGFSRSFSYMIDSSDLSPGTHEVSIKVKTGKDGSEMSSLSKIIRVYEGGVSNADDTWEQARDAGDWTGTTPEYDPDGIVGETPLTGPEYVGFYDRTDYRVITLEHDGVYTFALNGVENDLEIKLFSLTANGSLKERKSRVVSAANGSGTLADIPLLHGTYYVSVSAVNWETHGDSSYTLSVAGKGFLQGGNHDDWTDMKTRGIEGEVESIGAVTADSTSLVQNEWVGFGDEFDYRLFTLQSPAKLSFTVTASDAVEFAVCELQEKKDKYGNVSYGIKILQSRKIKAGESVRTDGLLLPAGEDHDKYCFYVKSTNAAKGGNADYSVSLNQPGCVFFPDGDNSDDWDDMKKNGENGAVGNAGTLNDESGTVLSGWVGFGDPVDYRIFTLDSAAKLGFRLDSTDAAKFTVWKLNKTDKKGAVTYSLKSLQAARLKPNGDGFVADTSGKGLFLEAGDYCFSMESTTAKKGGNAYYNVSLLGCEFYSDGDNTDDWGDMKTAGWAGAVADLGIMDGVRLEADDTIIADEWIGFGDKVDCKKFMLASAAELDFSFNTAGGFVKFTICKLKETEKRDGSKSYSQVKVKTVTATAKKPTVTIDDLRLEAGDYFIKAESTNTRKNTGYEAQITDSEFYSDGDGGWNNALLEKNALHKNAQYFYDNKLSVAGDIHFDKAGDCQADDIPVEYVYNEKQYGGFVGFGDEIDFAKLTVAQTVDVTFSLLATNDATLEVIQVKKNGATCTKKSLQTVKYKSGGEAALSKKSVTLEFRDDVEYYVSVKATNTKKAAADPRTFYNVTYAANSHESCALAMPEPRDSLALTDALDFGRDGTGDLASASASMLAELDGDSLRQNLALLG